MCVFYRLGCTGNAGKGYTLLWGNGCCAGCSALWMAGAMESVRNTMKSVHSGTVGAGKQIMAGGITGGYSV